MGLAENNALWSPVKPSINLKKNIYMQGVQECTMALAWLDELQWCCEVIMATHNVQNISLNTAC